MNLRGSNYNIRARGQIDRGGWWGKYHKVLSRLSCNIMMQQMHQLIKNGRSQSNLHYRLTLCVIGLIALVHRKNGWRGEQAISRDRVCITGATDYCVVVLHFV